MMFFTPQLEIFLSKPLSKRLPLRCLPCFKTTLPNRLLRSLFPTLCLIANSRLLTTSMGTKSPSSLLIGWTLIVQTWTLSSVKPFVVYKLVNWQPTAIPLPLQNDYGWYRIFWTISSICTIFFSFQKRAAIWYLCLFLMTETTLAMACWLVKPTSLQISPWMRSGSPTGICLPVVWERCSQRLSLTPESSRESRPHFPFQ